MNAKVKSQSSAYCEMRYRDRRFTEIAVSSNLYLECTLSTRGGDGKVPKIKGYRPKFMGNIINISY
eukprot:2553996-Pleurochrysis_carterae.AAC.2